MPSAASVKIEKPAGAATADNGLVDNANVTPLRQAITVVEHKIRNLEKRKSKLESYKDLQKSGKDLNQDQKTAIAKYDEVITTLDFARDLCKQFLSIAVVSEKDDKKKARKEAFARSQAELTKVREVLLIQDALSNMGQEVIRDDFLNARNGAAQLTQADIKLLDDYYTVVTPKHEAGDPTAFMPQVQAAAEHLLAAIDGKSKEVFGSTYANVKEVIGKVHESGYLDQAVETYDENAIEPEMLTETPAEPVMEQQLLQPVMEAPMLAAMPIVEQPPMQQQPMQMEPPMQPVVQAQPVPDQQIYYQQPPPAPQQRPIAEVIGTGSFFFLQDSELDTPPEQIPSQTFTNQTYVGAPPPPIPMPPQFHQQYQPNPQAPPQQPMPPQQQQQPPQQQQQQQQVQSSPPMPAPPMTKKNGYGDHQPEHQQDEVVRHRGNNNRHHQQRSNITTHHQTFFANNNGYNPRPNRNRNNAPRLNNRQSNNNNQQQPPQ